MPRKSRKIPYKKIIAIYCEGDSEKAYFEMLKRKYRAANVHVHSHKLVITSVGLSGMSLLKKAAQKVKRLKRMNTQKRYMSYSIETVYDKMRLQTVVNLLSNITCQSSFQMSTSKSGS